MRAARMLSSAEAGWAAVCFVPALLWPASAPSRLHYDSAFSTSYLLAFGVGSSCQLNPGRAADVERPASARTETFVLRTSSVATTERHNRARLSGGHRQIAFRHRTVQISSIWLG